jgi:hypothetical protein
MGGIYEEAHFIAGRCHFCRIISNCGRHEGKKQKQSTEAEEIAKQHDNTRRALRDALPLVLPSWSLPFYFGMHLDDTKNKKAEK